MLFIGHSYFHLLLKKSWPFPDTSRSMAPDIWPQLMCGFHISFFHDNFQYLQVQLQIKPSCPTPTTSVMNFLATYTFFCFDFLYPPYLLFSLVFQGLM